MHKKFIGQFKKPCRTHSNSPNAKAHREATPESHPQFFGVVKHFLAVDGTLYSFYEKHSVGVLSCRIEGGRWQKNIAANRIGVEKYLNDTGAKPAIFKRPKKSLKISFRKTVQSCKYAVPFHKPACGRPWK